jgi:hypothetical protein
MTLLKDIVKIENVLSEEELSKITSFLTHNDTPWYYLNTMVTGIEDRYPFFGHTAYINWKPNSALFSLILPILNKLKPTSILKIQANLVLAKENHFTSGWHTDFKYREGKTAIFYVTDSNGITVLQTTEEKVENKGIKNSLIIFPMQTEHQLISQTFPPERIVINFNYFD